MKRHFERTVHVAASPTQVFVRLDQQTREQANMAHDAVTERVYPRRKVWKTGKIANQAHRFIIGGYTMGYDVSPENGGTRLKVWIDVAPLLLGVAGFLAPLLAAIYARWRVDDLAQDAADSFTDMAAVVAAHP